MADEHESRPVPPYVSWATVLNKLEQMANLGIPSRIDASYLTGMAGGTQNQFKQALRSLGLIDADDRVTAALKELVQDAEHRPQRVGQLLTERYPALVGLGEDATVGQLREALNDYGLGAETSRKAASFFIAAATYAGLPLSPHIKPRSTGTGTRTTSRRRAASKKTGGQDAPPPPLGSTTGSNAVSHSIELASGGTVTVAVSMNIFELSKADRNFVLSLVDSLQEYAATDSPSSQATGVSRPDEGGAS